MRAVEKMVSGREAGDLPDDTKSVEAERHVLRFEVSGETFAIVREALKKVRAAPAKRRMVMRRDHGQRVVEGCRNATFVDVHHLKWRGDGGQHDVDAMCVLCGAHHRAAHLGTLRIEGKQRPRP